MRERTIIESSSVGEGVKFRLKDAAELDRVGDAECSTAWSSILGPPTSIRGRGLLHVKVMLLYSPELIDGADINQLTSGFFIPCRI